MASADLLLHPVRLRIIKAFLGGRALTTADLARELDDVPSGSLYRQIGLLASAGVLDVVAERRVRGAVERTYALGSRTARIEPDEVAGMTPGEHRRAFMAYLAGLLADFDRYASSGAFQPVADGADYGVHAMWLSDAEYRELLQDLADVIEPRLANAPTSQRRRRMLYSVRMPDTGASPQQPA